MTRGAVRLLLLFFVLVLTVLSFKGCAVVLGTLLGFQLLEKFTDAGECLLDVGEGVAVGCSDVPLAARAEGIAGDESDLFGVEESLAEFLRGETC